MDKIDVKQLSTDELVSLKSEITSELVKRDNRILCMDALTNRYFWVDSVSDLINRIIKLVNIYRNEGTLCVSDYTHEFCLPEMSFINSLDVAWDTERYYFEPVIEERMAENGEYEGRKCFIIGHHYPPGTIESIYK